MEKILEGSIINSKLDFHQQIATLLEFPDYYGQNLDALWDCLTEEHDPIILVFNDVDLFRKNVGDEFTEKVFDILTDAQKQLPDFKLVLK